MDSAKLEKIVNVSSPDAVVVSMAPSKRDRSPLVGQGGSIAVTPPLRTALATFTAHGFYNGRTAKSEPYAA